MGAVIFRPSGLPAGLRCLGSYALIAKLRADGTIPGESNSDPARVGTVGHSVSQECLDKNMDAKEFLGVTVVEDGLAVECDQDFVDAVQKYLDAVRETPGEHFVETRFDIDAFPIPDQSGTADFAALDKPNKTLYVKDLKFGQGVTVWADTEQAAAYGLGAYDWFSQFYDIEKVVVEIIQPRKAHSDIAEYTIPELEAFRTDCREKTTRAYAMLQGEIPLELTPGEKQCFFCPAQVHCKARKDQLLAVASSRFENLEETVTLDLPAAISYDTVLKLYPIAADLKKFLSRVEAAALEMHMAGNHIPGYKLVQGRKSYKWASETQAVDFLGMFLGENELYERKLVSVAQARKLMGKSAKSSEFTALVAEVNGRVSLAPESDRRKAIESGVEFENLESEDGESENE